MERTKNAKFLATIDSGGKFRQVAIGYSWNGEAYAINRITGTYKGKLTKQPEILITEGKVKRTIEEQVELQFNHLVKEYTDKGYKILTKPADKYSEEELSKIIGKSKTNREGLLKPMLAKQADSVSSSKTFNKNYYISRKINGTRCMMYWNGDRIKTAARGAMSYDIAAWWLRNNDKIIEWFKNHPNFILDGELYKHGWPLNKISGICRTQKTCDDGIDLEYYIYDVIDTENLDMEFNERLHILRDIAAELNIGFDPERNWNEGDLKFQMVPQFPITGFDNMKRCHDEYVKEGFEGAVIRLATGKYGPGKRTNDMIKIKQYKESEYLIVGLSEGLREEDMCFEMETPDGQRFKAKPIGDREQKQWYRDNINDIIGKMGTLKYFEMSGKEGSEIPQQPIFLTVRDYE